MRKRPRRRAKALRRVRPEVEIVSTMKGKAMRQTKCIDDIKCPYCGYMFNGSDAVNGDMDCTEATCPKCEKEMAISISVEYLATEIEN